MLCLHFRENGKSLRQPYQRPLGLSAAFPFIFRPTFGGNGAKSPDKLQRSVDRPSLPRQDKKPEATRLTSLQALGAAYEIGNDGEARQYLGISRETFYRMLQDGQIPCRVVAGWRKYNRLELEAIHNQVHSEEASESENQAG